MEQSQIGGRMLEFGKTVFDNTFTYMSTVQAQNEKIALRFLEKLPWIPEEGKKVFSQYFDTYKKLQEDYKSQADQSYKNVSSYFVSSGNGNNRAETSTTK